MALTGDQRAMARAVVRLTAERIAATPPTDFGQEFTLHEAFAGIALAVLDELDVPLIQERLTVLHAQEADR